MKNTLMRIEHKQIQQHFKLYTKPKDDWDLLEAICHDTYLDTKCAYLHLMEFAPENDLQQMYQMEGQRMFRYVNRMQALMESKMPVPKSFASIISAETERLRKNLENNE